ncbi:hypothetical protein SEA_LORDFARQUAAD_68 [Gordonia phage LordFarquaad]|uniref:Helix-turn-helix DNA binding domain protein n=3 Tax=Attisvirus attis TaxID=2169707 RepID=A0A142K8V7_9CAUD|nr:replication initiation protein [Gordonia phage SoilAssassin]YP_009595823.1 replication initiation protein [Gordonia phage Attis]AMS02466.1 hypothetical protein SEA_SOILASSASSIN_65 [Gordonia phage SoilAssassin]AMS02540.1 hypothetical protein SEA_ATTIS_65 [Gordonia phage Attis]QDF18388.1 hypothetical protein SEA_LORDFARQUAAD_68 [Gordonia phage LordFarquaad]
MARIRAIKPEFWSSPNHPSDPWTRLLYIAMWNWADDAGVGTANLKELAGFAFPNDDEIDVGAMRRMCADIAAHYGALFYTVGGRPYFSIPAWREHQKFDKRREGRHPGPEQAEAWLYQHRRGESAQCADSAPTVRPKVDATPAPEVGTGEPRNIGTGNPPAVPEVTHQGSREVAQRGTRASRRIADLNATSRSADADRFAAEFNRWAGGGIPVQARIEIAQEVDQLIADGISPHQIAEGVKAWHASDRLYASQIPAFVTKAARSAEPDPKPTKATLRAVDTLAATEALIAEFRESA